MREREHLQTSRLMLQIPIWKSLLFSLNPGPETQNPQKIPALLPGATWEHMAAHATHAALYAGLIVMPASGVAMGYYGGKGLPFFGMTIPGASKTNGAIAKQVRASHST